MLYGLESLIPKNHYSMHIPEQWLECLRRWFDCWPQECKHRIVIARASQVYNTEVFEKTLISRIWHDAYMRWTGDNLDKHFHSGVIGIQQNCQALADELGAGEAAVGSELHCDGIVVSASTSTLRMKLHCRAYGARKLHPGWYRAFVA